MKFNNPFSDAAPIHVLVIAVVTAIFLIVMVVGLCLITFPILTIVVLLLAAFARVGYYITKGK